MPAAEDTTQFTVASRKRCELAHKLGLPLPLLEWGPFRPLRACSVIKKRLGSNAQHIAIMLALETPTDGVRFVTHRALGEVTERPPETVSKALQAAIEAGLLHGKRTMGGHLYTWAEAVYQVPQDHRRRLFEGLSFANDNAPTQDELEGHTLWSYGKVWSKRYGTDKVDVAIDGTKLARITRRIGQFARKRQTPGESFGAAYRRTCDLCMTVWLAKEGNDGTNWLVERSHALSIMADGTRQAPDAELDFVVAAVARMDRNRATQANDRANTANAVENHVASPRRMGEFKPLDFAARPPRYLEVAS